jgi:enoyl-CoA hydratase/carnithine racemase
MAYETITYEVDEQILTITLNRPDKLNAFNGTMQQELIDAFDQADKDDDVRAIIVTGAGRGFCAGADLSSGADTFDRDADRSSGSPTARSTTATPMCATAAARSRCASSNA